VSDATNDADDVRLQRQYDVYQRYHALARCLDAAFAGTGEVGLLDVGSGGVDLCRTFLPARFRATLADTGEFGRSDVVRLVAGAPLPFADRSFAGVVAMDVLEHVPPGDRDRLVAECARVAADVVVISHPLPTPAVRRADAFLAAVHRACFGTENAFLVEHAAHGLPDPREVARVLSEAGFAVAEVPDCPLSDWLALTVLDMLLLAAFGDGREKASFNRAANLIGGSVDHEESYRTFVVAARDPTVLRRAADALRARARARSAPAGTAFDVLVADALAALAGAGKGAARERDSLGAMVGAKDAHIRKLEALVDEINRQRLADAGALADLRAAVTAKDEHIRKLEALVEELHRRHAAATQQRRR
jgi:SAM-dependent methyltransferase